jgi:ribonucleoside-diphosphate reductase alpha chain
MSHGSLPAELVTYVKTDAPPVSDNAQMIMAKRYFVKDDAGTPIEDVDAMYWRVAQTLAAPEAAFNGDAHVAAVTFFRLMRGRKFLPNSPTLANAGARTGQLSACYVLPVSDAISDGVAGIYDTLTKAQLIMQTGGGVGYSFSRLRGKDALVKGSMGIASGPLSYMRVYDTACDEMKQGGMRRGAQMAILRCDHPDILAFIEEKQDLTKLTNFNVSVAITDAFLEKLNAPDDTYMLVDPAYGETQTFVHAREVWERIATRAWSTGEPGLFFIDRANRDNPAPHLGRYEATNPCGEQPLIPYESCNLGSLTLDQFVDREGKLNWEQLRMATHEAIWLMDNVVTANRYVPKVPEIQAMALTTRKLGLGIMGLGRMLFKMGLGYNTPDGREVAALVYAFIDAHSKLASQDLARRRGSFPYYSEHRAESEAFYRALWGKRLARCRDNAGQNPLWQEVAALYEVAINRLPETGLRNSTTTTIAPTGTLSMFHDTSGGCEPVFALAFKRFQAGLEMAEADPVLADKLSAIVPDEAVRQRVLLAIEQEKGSLNRLLLSPKLFELGLVDTERRALNALAATFVCAADISPTNHVLMQAALQAFNDSATSKTINMPESASVQDVKDAYDLAIKTDCKGITVYRDGSRSYQPLTAGDKSSKQLAEQGAAPAEVPATPAAGPRVRPEDLFGFTRVVPTGDGRLYLSVNYDGEGVREVVATIGRSGGTLNSLAEAIGRLVSLALQHRVPLRELAATLVGIRTANPVGFGPNKVLSIPDAIGRTLAQAPASLGMPTAVPTAVSTAAAPSDTAFAVVVMGENPECPECHADLVFAEGCKKCSAGCGYTACG